jgi:hypothetical protein
VATSPIHCGSAGYRELKGNENKMISTKTYYTMDKMVGDKVDGKLMPEELKAFTKKIEEGLQGGKEFSPALYEAYAIIQSILKDTNIQITPFVRYWHGLYTECDQLITNDTSFSEVITADMEGNADGRTSMGELATMRSAMCLQNCEINLIEIPLSQQLSMIAEQFNCEFNRETKAGKAFDTKLSKYAPKAAKAMDRYIKILEGSLSDKTPSRAPAPKKPVRQESI